MWFAGLITNGRLNLWEQGGIEPSVHSLLGRANIIHSLPAAIVTRLSQINKALTSHITYMLE